jgi:hypothetical protein
LVKSSKNVANLKAGANLPQVGGAGRCDFACVSGFNCLRLRVLFGRQQTAPPAVHFPVGRRGLSGQAEICDSLSITSRSSSPEVHPIGILNGVLVKIAQQRNGAESQVLKEHLGGEIGLANLQDDPSPPPIGQFGNQFLNHLRSHFATAKLWSDREIEHVELVLVQLVNHETGDAFVLLSHHADTISWRRHRKKSSSTRKFKLFFSICRTSGMSRRSSSEYAHQSDERSSIPLTTTHDHRPTCLVRTVDLVSLPLEPEHGMSSQSQRGQLETTFAERRLRNLADYILKSTSIEQRLRCYKTESG